VDWTSPKAVLYLCHKVKTKHLATSYIAYTKGTGSFTGVKRPERGVDHPPPFRDEVEGRVELHLYSLLGLRGLF
jgi:hypothetical protein